MTPSRELPTSPQLLELTAAKLSCGYVDNSLSPQTNPIRNTVSTKSLLSFCGKRKKQRKTDKLTHSTGALSSYTYLDTISEGDISNELTQGTFSWSFDMHLRM